MDFKNYNRMIHGKNNFSEKFSNVNIVNYIISIVITSVFFVNGVVLYQYYSKGILPPTEIVIAFNSFCGVELLSTMVIAVSKNRREVD